MIIKANRQAATDAVRRALVAYATSLECTFEGAVALFRDHESTRECIALLVLAQADPQGLAAMAGQMPEWQDYTPLP